MKKEIIISGFGGQGVLSMGKILAYSGLMEDKEVTWMPAYGPEQRGGTANVTVIVSDERISSPILSKYDVAIVLNQPSLDKFLPKVKPGGILIYDGFGIAQTPVRDDINVYRIDAMDKAAEMKNSKVFNMIVLGGLLKVCPVVTTNGLEKALFKSLPERHHGLIPLNMQAVDEGMKIIEKVGFLVDSGLSLFTYTANRNQGRICLRCVPDFLCLVGFLLPSLQGGAGGRLPSYLFSQSMSKSLPSSVTTTS